MAVSRDRTGFGTVQNLEKVVFAYHGAAVRRGLRKLRANLVHGQCAVVYGACRLTIQCAQRLGRHNAEMRKQQFAHFLVDRHSALHIAGAEQTAHEVLIQILLIRLNMNRPTAQRNGFDCALLLFEQLDRTGCRTGVQAVIVGHDWNSPDFIGHARQRIAGIQCQCSLIFRQTDIVISGGFGGMKMRLKILNIEGKRHNVVPEVSACFAAEQAAKSRLQLVQRGANAVKD